MTSLAIALALRAAAQGLTPADAKAVTLPPDVAAFQRRRASCDQLRGEEPYDAERARWLWHAVAKACAGTDAALAALKAQHRGDEATLAALSLYEATVK